MRNGQLKPGYNVQIEKVTLEVGWLSLAHNPGKQATISQKSRAAILQ
ncbi:hypothetical protein GCM10010912_21130 [Paenibacillus albidus]|uniref:Uncharacterized protein n=2 Tax=Paenibacillus albidus TaxID=2041023 RepID=A0A917C7T6_9BACL|nr:hypothetical protein GCM10010912_21130 [Paenibacillus albidus]